jgi:hypothetical protein
MNVFSILLLSSLIVVSFASVSYAKWSYGIGTGFFGLNIDGTLGIHTNQAGPVDIDIDMDASDTRDLMESVFGFGGYATDDTWVIRYSFVTMELEGSDSTYQPQITSDLFSKAKYEWTGAEITVGYPIYRTSYATITLDGGLRYTKQEISTTLIFTGGVNETELNNYDNDWTDLLVGATATVPLSDKWAWTVTGNAGFGDSEGTYMGSTAVNWRFFKKLSASLYYKYIAVEYKTGSRGSSHWYHYDADEFGLGINVLYNF